MPDVCAGRLRAAAACEKIYKVTTKLVDNPPDHVYSSVIESNDREGNVADSYCIQVRNAGEKWLVAGFRSSLLVAHDDAESAIRREGWSEARVRCEKQTLHHVTRLELEALAMEAVEGVA